MTKNIRFTLGVFSIILLVLCQCCFSQVTFSRNWEAAGGKRSGRAVFAVPELYFKLAANSICQNLLSEIKQMVSCETRAEEDNSIFPPN